MIRHVHYSSAPILYSPRVFFCAAVADLAASLRPGRLFAISALRARYRRAWLGYLWLFVPAIATAAASTVLRRTNIIIMRDTPIPYPLFALAGMLLWQGFVDGLAMPYQQVSANRLLLTRTPIPHETVLVAGLSELALNGVIRIAALCIAAVAFGVAAQATWLFLPLGLALLIALGVAVGLFLSPLSLLFEDVARAIGLITGFALLLTPVLYPLPEGSPLWLNPVAPLLDGTRGWISGVQPSRDFFVAGTLCPIGVVAGWLLYRLARPHLIERLG
jgi:lipopolysaccharide transport system permease protein